MKKPRHPAYPILRAYGLNRLADECGVIHYAAWKWAAFGVPPERVVAVARLLDVRPHDLRPDLYGPHDRGPDLNTESSGAHTSNDRAMVEMRPTT
jgi:DNA-binding transcriptional regulator YdaS (Cro superfamily)